LDGESAMYSQSGQRAGTELTGATFLVALVAVGCSLIPVPVCGDGFVVNRNGEYVPETEQRAYITWTNGMETLVALCNWCVDRDYLEANPLRKLRRFDITPRTTRRALTREEIDRLLSVAEPDRRLLYEVALCSGLRAKELRSLKVADLDTNSNGLWLDAAWTKNRKAGFQPLPPDLVCRLAAKSAGKAPGRPLLTVPKWQGEALAWDMKRAGIPRDVPGRGKVDFHALRVTLTTLLVESGANVKEAQSLLRHSTPPPDHERVCQGPSRSDSSRRRPDRRCSAPGPKVGLKRLAVEPLLAMPRLA
jgi:integrase